MSTRWPRPLVAALDLLNRRGAAVAVRLTRYTGKSAHAVHPKHLSDAPWHHWYVEHLKPNDLVLDLGCGNGAHALVAARCVRRVVGVDYDRVALGVAADSSRRAFRGNLRLFAADLTGRLPFRDSSFDAVLFLDVIEHLEPRRRVLGEIARVLRPDGRLLVSAPNRETSWRRRLREAGLRVLRSRSQDRIQRGGVPGRAEGGRLRSRRSGDARRLRHRVGRRHRRRGRPVLARIPPALRLEAAGRAATTRGEHRLSGRRAARPVTRPA